MCAKNVRYDHNKNNNNYKYNNNKAVNNVRLFYSFSVFFSEYISPNILSFFFFDDIYIFQLIFDNTVFYIKYF